MISTPFLKFSRPSMAMSFTYIDSKFQASWELCARNLEQRRYIYFFIHFLYFIFIVGLYFVFIFPKEKIQVMGERVNFHQGCSFKSYSSISNTYKHNLNQRPWASTPMAQGHYAPSTAVTMVRKSVNTFYRDFLIAKVKTERNSQDKSI